MQSPTAIARREKYRLRVKIGGNVARLDVSRLNVLRWKGCGGDCTLELWR